MNRRAIFISEDEYKSSESKYPTYTDMCKNSHCSRQILLNFNIFLKDVRFNGSPVPVTNGGSTTIGKLMSHLQNYYVKYTNAICRSDGRVCPYMGVFTYDTDVVFGREELVWI